MNIIKLFWLLRKNTKLNEKRNPMFEANQYGKFFTYTGAAFVAIEFIALGTFLGWIAVPTATDLTRSLHRFSSCMSIASFRQTIR